jgi:EAL domain-containing protein (putative c-di-GMP-specific phosphodiesterase class I)
VLQGKSLRLAFNISPLQLKDLSLARHIRRMAEDAGFPLESLPWKSRRAQSPRT